MGGECVPDCAEKRAVALVLEDVDGLVWQCCAGPLERLEAGFEVDEGELEVAGAREGFEDLTAGLGFVIIVIFSR